jgi:hypothetical protein
VAEQPLWSERHGGTLPLTAEGFATLLVHALDRLTDEGYFAEVLKRGGPRWLRSAPRAQADAFFAMKLGDPWASYAMTSVVSLQYADDARIFDILELLHRDVVSEPVREPEPPLAEGETTPFDDPVSFAKILGQLGPPQYDKAAGQLAFRERINPILGRREPPLEMDTTGSILQRVAEPFRRLIEQPLQETAPKREVTDRVDDAIAHFRRREATTGDRRAAVRELADVLEFLRDDVKQHLLRKDEGDLFRLANEFALRHNKPTTRRDFDEPVWLAWMFYVYLATIRLTLELRQRARAEVRSTGP